MVSGLDQVEVATEHRADEFTLVDLVDRHVDPAVRAPLVGEDLSIQEVSHIVGGQIVDAESTELVDQRGSGRWVERRNASVFEIARRSRCKRPVGVAVENCSVTETNETSW